MGGLTLSSSEPHSRSQRGTRRPAAPAAPVNDMEFDYDYRDDLQDARSTGTSSDRTDELERQRRELLRRAAEIQSEIDEAVERRSNASAAVDPGGESWFASHPVTVNSVTGETRTAVPLTPQSQLLPQVPMASVSPPRETAAEPPRETGAAPNITTNVHNIYYHDESMQMNLEMQHHHHEAHLTQVKQEAVQVLQQQRQQYVEHVNLLQQ